MSRRVRSDVASGRAASGGVVGTSTPEVFTQTFGVKNNGTDTETVKSVDTSDPTVISLGTSVNMPLTIRRTDRAHRHDLPRAGLREGVRVCLIFARVSFE